MAILKVGKHFMFVNPRRTGLTAAIIAEVAAFPGRTAWEITEGIHDGATRQLAAVVSSVLARLAKQGRVRRTEEWAPGETGPWRYFPDDACEQGTCPVTCHEMGEG